MSDIVECLVKWNNLDFYVTYKPAATLARADKSRLIPTVWRSTLQQ